MNKLISIVVSAYNEEKNISELYSHLFLNIQKCTNVDFEIIIVNDGSSDDTLAECKKLSHDKRIRIVNFFRNFGHEIAMTAGLDHANGDAVIFMDADLQHPPELIPAMVQKWQEGNEIVLMKRSDTEGVSLLRKFLGFVYYKIMNMLSEVVIPSNTPDFRLIGKQYINVIRKMDERERMFRGLLNWIGTHDAVYIEFIAPKRFAGETHYNFYASMKLAINGIVQFSIKPLRIATYIGFFTSCFSFLFGIYTIYEHYFLQSQTSGYATIICILAFFSGLQMLVLGILGEYIGRIHIETKRRPLYICEVL